MDERDMGEVPFVYLEEGDEGMKNAGSLESRGEAQGLEVAHSDVLTENNPNIEDIVKKVVSEEFSERLKTAKLPKAAVVSTHRPGLSELMRRANESPAETGRVLGLFDGSRKFRGAN